MNQLSKTQTNKPSESADKKTDKDKKPNSALASTSNISLTGSSSDNHLQVDSIYCSEPKQFDRLLAQSLGLFESCLSLFETTEIDTSSKRISCELMSLISAPLVSHKARSLLWNSLKSQSSSSNASLSLYNSCKDEALVNMLATSFQPFHMDHLYDLENLQKSLLVCKYMVYQQRAHNLVRFITEKFNSTDTFLINLNSLFWRIANQYIRASCNLNEIGCPVASSLNSIVEALIETMHAFLLIDSRNNRVIVDAYTRLLCSDSLEINFCARKTLLNLLKQTKKSASNGTSITALSIANPTTASVEKTEKSPTKQTKNVSSAGLAEPDETETNSATVGGSQDPTTEDLRLV